MDIPTWLADTFGDITVAQVIIWIVAIVLVIYGARKVWPALRAIVKFADTWQKLPSFMERTDESIRKQSTQLDGIFHETHKNDGSSIKDSTVRLESAVAGLHGRLDSLETSNTKQEATLTDVQDKLVRDHGRLKDIEDTFTPDELARLKQQIKENKND